MNQAMVQKVKRNALEHFDKHPGNSKDIYLLLLKNVKMGNYQTKHLIRWEGQNARKTARSGWMGQRGREEVKGTREKAKDLGCGKGSG